MHRDWFKQTVEQQRANRERQMQMYLAMQQRKRMEKKVKLPRTPKLSDDRVVTCHKCSKTLGVITLLSKSQIFSRILPGIHRSSRYVSAPARTSQFTPKVETSPSTSDVDIFATCMECLNVGMREQRIGKKKKATEEV